MDISKDEIDRSHFPTDFIFGAGTSAYQIEGGWNADGKGVSNWDKFALHTPGSIADGTNGCTAVDHYNVFKDDVALIKKVGLDAYRFSIAWTRILPAGKLCGGVSKEGVKFYNDLIDALLAEGIEPWATLFHWDLPQCLEDEYEGFLNKQIVTDFCDFADVCFWEFGDRVKRWTTFNEPWSYVYMGYVTGFFPPGRGGIFTSLINQAKDDAKNDPTANLRKQDAKDDTTGNSRKPDAKHDATKNLRKLDDEDDSNEDSTETESDSDDDLDWLPCFSKIVSDTLTGPQKIVTKLPVRTQQLTHRSPLGDPFDPCIDSEEDSDTDEDDSSTDDEDSDADRFLYAMSRNLVGYTLLQRDIEKKQSACDNLVENTSLQRFLGLCKPAAKQRDQPATATATATAQKDLGTKQPTTAAAQKQSQVTSLEKKAPALKGDPGTEPYIAAHNMLLAHAYAVQIYRTRYKKHHGGEIGITNVAVWYYPHKDTQEDTAAVSRALDFQLGWFVAPVIAGDYPTSMRNIVRQRLPKFTPEEVTLIKGSYDFIGINYYTTYYVTSKLRTNGLRPHHDNDIHVEHLFERDGEPIGKKGGSEWLYIVPEGIYHLMLYMKERYNNPVMYITENGVDEKNIKTNTISKARNDETRIDYHKKHLACLKKAMEDGVCLKGYFIWSLLDNFEWAQGYNVRFGIFCVDFVNGRLARYPKSSAKWWMNFLNKTPIPQNALTCKPETLKKQQTEKTETEKNKCH